MRVHLVRISVPGPDSELSTNPTTQGVNRRFRPDGRCRLGNRRSRVQTPLHRQRSTRVARSRMIAPRHTGRLRLQPERIQHAMRTFFDTLAQRCATREASPLLIRLSWTTLQAPARYSHPVCKPSGTDSLPAPVVSLSRCPVTNIVEHDHRRLATGRTFACGQVQVRPTSRSSAVWSR